MRITSLGLTILFVVLGCENTENSATETLNTAEPRPNIIFLFADDQAPNTLAAYGNKHIHTPNLDKLAAEGMNFKNAYNMGAWDGAVCKASRAMLNSGLPVWKAYAQANEQPKATRVAQSWAKQLENSGYDTYFTGKWHVPMPVSDVFTHAVHERPGMPNDGWDHHTQVKHFKDLAEGTGQFKHYKEFMPVGYNRPLNENDTSWSPTDPRFGGFYEGGQHWSEVLKDDALSFLENATSSDKPFFMYLAFNAPHDPRQAPRAFQSLYDHKSLPLPKNWQALYPEKEAIGNGPALRDAALAPFPRTEHATQVHIKEYYALISHLDAQIGYILDALEQQGLADNTYIFFTADHGLAVGEHGLFGKQNMYEHSMRAPFIVVGPGIKKNTDVDADTYIQDIMPTTLELAGITPPDYVYFHSLVPFFDNPDHDGFYKRIYGAYVDSQRMIKKGDFKLIVYPTIQRIKLFNLKDDPMEMNDLSREPMQERRIKELFTELQEAQTAMMDPLSLSHIKIN